MRIDGDSRRGKAIDGEERADKRMGLSKLEGRKEGLNSTSEAHTRGEGRIEGRRKE
jgi:hypothetical protein